MRKSVVGVVVAVGGLGIIFLANRAGDDKSADRSDGERHQPKRERADAAGNGRSASAKPKRSTRSGGGRRLVTAQNVSLSNPPRGAPGEYSGDELRWRMRFPLSDADLDKVVEKFARLTGPQQVDALRNPSFRTAAIADRLLQLRKAVKDTRQPLHYYAAAVLASATSLAKEQSAGRHTGWQTVDTLVATALETDAQRVSKFSKKFSPQEWSGIRRRLKKVGAVVPEYRGREEFQSPLDEIREYLDEVLRLAQDARPEFRGGVHAFRLAAAMADSGICDRLLECVRGWGTMRRRFPGERDRAVVLMHCIRPVLSGGTTEQKHSLGPALAIALGAEDQPMPRETVWKLGEMLAELPGLDKRSRLAITAQQPRSDRESGLRNHILRIVNEESK